MRCSPARHARFVLAKDASSGGAAPQRGVGSRTEGGQGILADLSLTNDLACLSVGTPMKSCAADQHRWKKKAEACQRVHVTVTIGSLNG
jgi:hypothetical protein